MTLGTKVLDDIHTIFRHANWYANIAYDANKHNRIVLYNVSPEDYYLAPYDRAMYIPFIQYHMEIKLISAESELWTMSI